MSRLRDQQGFSLPELLTALSIAVIVSLAAFSLIEFTMRRTGEIHGRVEASQRGRAAMDTMTRQLRSQVCLSSTVPPVAGADVSKASFYVDLTDGSTAAPPELHTLTYDAVKRRIVEQDFVGAGVAPAIVYPALPTRTKTLVENVIPYQPAGAAAPLPIFRYFAYDLATPPRPSVALPTPLSATDLGRVSRIEIAYRALRTTAKPTETRGSIALQDEVYVRAADPNDPAPTPTCA
jgi:prepilin-type N-terminal cleavage/methylation domain-containing protein